MNSKQNHTIQKIILDLKINTNQKEAVEIQNYFSENFIKNFSSGTDNYLSSLVPENQRIVINDLVVDVGEISVSNLKTNFFELVLDKLKIELSKIKLNENLKTKIKSEDSLNANIKAIIFFLQNGYYPWWFDSKSIKNFNLLFFNTLKNSSSFNTKILKEIFSSENSSNRLFNNLNLNSINLIINSLYPDFFSKVKILNNSKFQNYKIIIARLLKSKLENLSINLDDIFKDFEVKKDVNKLLIGDYNYKNIQPEQIDVEKFSKTNILSIKSEEIITNELNSRISDISEKISKHQTDFSLNLFGYELLFSIIYHFLIYNSFPEWSEKLISALKFKNKLNENEEILIEILKNLLGRNPEILQRNIIEIFYEKADLHEIILNYKNNLTQVFFSIIYIDVFQEFTLFKNKVLSILKQNFDLNDDILNKLIARTFIFNSDKIRKLIKTTSDKIIDFEQINQHFDLSILNQYKNKNFINEFLSGKNINYQYIIEFNVLLKHYLEDFKYFNKDEFLQILINNNSSLNLFYISSENKILIINLYFSSQIKIITSTWNIFNTLFSQSSLKIIPYKTIENLFQKITIQSLKFEKVNYFSFLFHQLENYLPSFQNEIFSVLKKSKPEKYSDFIKLLKTDTQLFTNYLNFKLNEFKSKFQIDSFEKNLILEISQNSDLELFVIKEFLYFLQTGNFENNILLKTSERTEIIIKSLFSEKFIKILSEQQNFFTSIIVLERLLNSFSNEFIDFILKRLINSQLWDLYQKSLLFFEILIRIKKNGFSNVKKYFLINLLSYKYTKNQFYKFFIKTLQNTLIVDNLEFVKILNDVEKLSENKLKSFVPTILTIIEKEENLQKPDFNTNEKEDFEDNIDGIQNLKIKEIQDVFGNDKENIYQKIIEEKFDWLDNKKDGNKIYIENAGLILLWVFLPRFFNRLKLTEKVGKRTQFINSENHVRAVLLTQYLYNGKLDFHENELVLNKILCGFKVEQPISLNFQISEEEKTECENLLKSAIKHWSVLGNSSIEGLRQNFLKRNGILVYKSKSWNLKVEQKAIDVLLKKLPWTYQTIKLPWNSFFLFADWNN